MKKVTKAVIPAAGLGTRVLPATKAMPKGMLPIVDKHAIQYLVEEAVRSGITDILIILGRNQSIIEDHFVTGHQTSYGISLNGTYSRCFRQFSDQQTRPLRYLLLIRILHHFFGNRLIHQLCIDFSRS